MAIAVVTAGGEVPTTRAAVYTAPALTEGLVRVWRVCNTGSAKATVTAYVTPSGGSARRWATVELEASGGAADLCSQLPLATGDALELVSDLTGVDYFVAVGQKT
jgi:hypothetical protein